MPSDKPGQYWDEALNMARHIDCHCEVGDDKCWAKLSIKRWGWKLGWFPEQANKVSTTGKPKVYAVQWLGDIAFLDVEQILEIITTMTSKNTIRKVNGLRRHTFLVLTKWPDKFYKKLIAPNIIPFLDNNIYIGISASDQRTFDKRIEWLLKFDGFKKWVSLEPLYGNINLCGEYDVLNGIQTVAEHEVGCDGYNYNYCPVPVPYPIPILDQVIIGGETGGSYKADLDHYCSIRDQCEAANVPFFIKHIDRKNKRTLDGTVHNNLIWRM